MPSPSAWKLGLLPLLAAGAVVSAAWGAAAAPATTAPPDLATIKVTLTERALLVTPRVARRGTIARFVLVNTGTRSRTFVLYRPKGAPGRRVWFARTLRPGQRRFVTLFLDYRGLLPYRAGRATSGLTGSFRVR